MPNDQQAVDPVCGMTVDRATAAGTSTYRGATLYFCSAACKTRFDANPAQYAGAADGAGGDTTGTGDGRRRA